MKYVLAPVVIVLMGFVVLSLVRGIAAFLASTRQDMDHDPASGPSPMQLRQNDMMTKRIKFQLAAIAVVGLLALLTHKG